MENKKMAIDQKLAQQVVRAYQDAGRPIADVAFISTMWSERQAREKLAEVRQFQKRPSTATKKPDQPKDENQLTAMDFRDFIEKFPRGSLDGVPKYMVSSVGLVMSNHCTYETGKQMMLTAKALADLSGVGHRGVVRVLELLERVGAITKTRGLPHPKGRPSVEYEFTRSPFVNQVLSPDSIVVHEQSIVVAEQSNVAHEQLIRL